MSRGNSQTPQEVEDPGLISILEPIHSIFTDLERSTVLTAWFMVLI